ncbi:MAG TPA: Calx-beta domain-containing protein, partial [Aggregatilineales bacterium]|nr:Calx-beta domain-containing protein [Aggregatilineales bacterium]
VQWNELYHSATADNPRSEFVPTLAETFFSVDPSGLYYPSTQANVYVLVDNNDITGAQVIYWDGDSTEYAPMSYVTDFTGAFKSQPSNQYSIWRATLPAPMSFAPAQGAGFNVCYRIQVWDGSSNAWLRYTNGVFVNPLGQHVINADSSTDNYCQTVQAFPTIGLVTGTDMQAENVVNRNIPLTISSAINAPITVNITYADGSAMLSDNDYTNTTTSFTIPANTSGSYGATLTGLINNDNKYELNDSFTVTLASVATGNASISLGSTISYILTNDDPVPTVSWATTTASQTEGNIGSAGYFFTANLSNPSYQTIIVDVNYADIAATYPVDYGLSNTVTINAGSTTGLHTYLIVADTVDESNEDFTL